MRKKIVSLILTLTLVFSFSTSAFATSNSWNIEGSHSNFFQVRSQGSISIDFWANTVDFNGWASSIFAGGFGAPIEMKIWAKTFVAYYVGASNSNITTDTRTVNGTNQVNVSVTIQDAYIASGTLSAARVYANGYLKFLPPVGSSSDYWNVTAVGDHGWN